MTKNFIILSFVLALFAVSNTAIAQDSSVSEKDTKVTKVEAADKATATETASEDKSTKKACCASKAGADAGKSCAGKASASATADASDGDAPKKACCADGKKKDCKDKGAKAEAAPVKDI